jgi:hypothetical protein
MNNYLERIWKEAAMPQFTAVLLVNFAVNMKVNSKGFIP